MQAPPPPAAAAAQPAEAMQPPPGIPMMYNPSQMSNTMQPAAPASTARRGLKYGQRPAYPR